MCFMCLAFKINIFYYYIGLYGRVMRCVPACQCTCVSVCLMRCACFLSRPKERKIQIISFPFLSQKQCNDDNDDNVGYLQTFAYFRSDLFKEKTVLLVAFSSEKNEHIHLNQHCFNAN